MSLEHSDAHPAPTRLRGGRRLPTVRPWCHSSSSNRVAASASRPPGRNRAPDQAQRPSMRRMRCASCGSRRAPRPSPTRSKLNCLVPPDRPGGCPAAVGDGPWTHPSRANPTRDGGRMRFIPTRALIVSGAALVTAAAMLLLPTSPAAAAKPQVTITSGPTVNRQQRVPGLQHQPVAPSHPFTSLHPRHRHHPRLRLLRNADETGSQPDQSPAHPHRTGRRHLHVHRQGQVQERTTRHGHLGTFHHHHLHRPVGSCWGNTERSAPIFSTQAPSTPSATPFLMQTRDGGCRRYVFVPPHRRAGTRREHGRCPLPISGQQPSSSTGTLNLDGYTTAPADFWTCTDGSP